MANLTFNGQSLTFNGTHLSFPQFDADAEAIFARMTTPNLPLRRLINKTVEDLKSAGIWAKADVIRFMKIDKDVNGLINWVRDANHATMVNSPMFSPYNGFRSSGPTGGYLNTRFNPYGQAVNMIASGTSIAYGIGPYYTGMSDYYVAGGYPNAAPYIIFRPYRSNNTVTVYVNSAVGASSFASPVVYNLHHMRRQNKTQQSYKKDGAAFVTVTNSGHTNMPNLNMYELAANGNGTAQGKVIYEMTFAYYGKDLTDTESNNLYTIYNYWYNNVVSTIEESNIELVFNGGFNGASNWTIVSGWTISSGVASWGGIGTGTMYNLNANTIQLGRTYHISFDVTAISGTPRMFISNTSGVAVFAAPFDTYFYLQHTGRYDIVVTATINANYLSLWGSSTYAGTFSIDNLSMKEVT